MCVFFFNPVHIVGHSVQAAAPTGPCDRNVLRFHMYQLTQKLSSDTMFSLKQEKSWLEEAVT